MTHDSPAANHHSSEHLLALVDAWTLARRIEGFLHDTGDGVETLPVDEREVIVQRLSRARALFGGPEALRHFLERRTPEERELLAERAICP